MKVLCVDDDRIMRFILSKTFERLGYEVILATDGEDAFCLLTEKIDEIDMIILDLEMPKADGFDFMEMVMRSNFKKHPQLLIHSSYSVEETLNKMASKNTSTELINGFLNKPVSLEELLKYTKTCMPI